MSHQQATTTQGTGEHDQCDELPPEWLDLQAQLIEFRVQELLDQ